MKQPYKPTLRRFERFKVFLRERRPGESIPISEVTDYLRKSEKGKEPARWDRIINDLVDLYSRLPENERVSKVTSEHGYVNLIEAEVPPWEARKDKNSAQKRMVAKRLLFWLFDQSSLERATEEAVDSANFADLEDAGFEVNWQPGSATARTLNRKISILRARTLVSMVVDAGTTNLALAKVLSGQNVSLPLRVRALNSEIKSDRPESQHPKPKLRLRLSLTTNSIPIANEIGERESRDSLSLKLIGGTENPARRSLTGEGSLVWAKNLQGRGQSDIAIIGTTGVRFSEDGIYLAFMDDEFECELKGALLEGALLKIIICDASKILMGACVNSFCDLIAEKVDLVVTDDGKALYESSGPFEGEQEYVISQLDEFRAVCESCGVGVLTVKSP